MFDETFSTPITLYKRDSINVDGDVTYQSQTIYARVEPYVKQLLNQKGEEFTSSAQVFTRTLVRAGDKLELDGETRLVQIDSRADSLFGDSTHYEVIV
jgi:hypothetical protein